MGELRSPRVADQVELISAEREILRDLLDQVEEAQIGTLTADAKHLKSDRRREVRPKQNVPVALSERHEMLDTDRCLPVVAVHCQKQPIAGALIILSGNVQVIDLVRLPARCQTLHAAGSVRWWYGHVVEAPADGRRLPSLTALS